MFEANCSEQVGQREKTILDPVFLVPRVAVYVFWTLQCGRSFGIYSVAGLLDSIVWHVFRTLQCGMSFRLYSMAGLLDSTVC